MPWKKAISLHFKALIFYFHHEWSTEVYEISITDVGKKCIRKTIGILLPQMAEISLPKKIDEMRKLSRWFDPVIIIFEMRNVKKLYVLHGSYLH